MDTERLHLPAHRSLLQALQQNETLSGLLRLVAAMVHRPEPADTSIAWEDGEAEEPPPDERR